MRYRGSLSQFFVDKDTALFASYLTDSLSIAKLYTQSPRDTFKIRSSRDYVEVITPYKVTEMRTFLLRSGDTVDVRFNAHNEPVFESRCDSGLNTGYNILLSANDSSLRYNFLPFTLRDSYIFWQAAYMKTHDPELFARSVLAKNYVDSDSLQLAIERFKRKYQNLAKTTSLWQQKYFEYHLKLLEQGDKFEMSFLSDDYIEYLSYHKHLNRYLGKYLSNKDIPSTATDMSGNYVEKGAENAFAMLYDTLCSDDALPRKTRLALLGECLQKLKNSDHPSLNTHTQHYLSEGGNQEFAQKLLGVVEYDQFSSLKLIDSQGMNLSLEDVINKHKGKVIYLDFWATNCAPCLGAMPSASKLREEMAGKDVVFIFVALWDKKRTGRCERGRLSARTPTMKVTLQPIPTVPMPKC